MSAFADEERRRRRAATGIFCLTLLGVTLASLAHVAVQAKRTEVAAALGFETTLHQELRDRQHHLKIEISRLRDPARLEKEAREKLGMEPLLAANIHIEVNAAESAAHQRDSALRRERERLRQQRKQQQREQQQLRALERAAERQRQQEPPAGDLP